MITYWTLGRRFAEDHDRAIRFQFLPSHGRMKELNIPINSKQTFTYCDRCHVYHLTLETSASVIATGIAKKGSESDAVG